MSVQQRRKNDCTIAAVANALGLTYHRVKTACGPVGKGLYSHEISWLLSKLDADWQLTRVRKPYPLERFVELRPQGRYV